MNELGAYMNELGGGGVGYDGTRGGGVGYTAYNTRGDMLVGGGNRVNQNGGFLGGASSIVDLHNTITMTPKIRDPHLHRRGERGNETNEQGFRSVGMLRQRGAVAALMRAKTKRHTTPSTPHGDWSVCDIMICLRCIVYTRSS